MSKFSRFQLALFATICPSIALIKYFLYVCTSHVISLFEGESPRGLEPPAAPPECSKLFAQNTFRKIPVICPDLGLGRSPREKNSWTSRFQNLKLHAPILNLDDFRENRSTGSRDICICVSIFLRFQLALFATTCIRAVNRQPCFPREGPVEPSRYKNCLRYVQTAKFENGQNSMKPTQK